MRVLFVTAIVVFFDQITKILVKGISIPFLNINIKGMDYAQSINVIGDFFKITFVENPGMAFGIDVGGTSKLFLSLFSLIASIGIFYYLFNNRSQRYVVRVALALILGGAIGNLIDRTFYGIIYDYAPIFYGKVVDFFNVDFFDFTIFGRTYERWPIFNIADSAVTVGVILILLFNKDVDKKRESDEAEESELNSLSDGETSVTENEEQELNEEQNAQIEVISKTEDGEDNNREKDRD